MENSKPKIIHGKKRLLRVAILCVACIAINFLGSTLASILNMPLYLDAIGTVLSAALGGYLPGIVVGLLTNALKWITDPASIYYGSINVLIAVVAAFFSRKHFKHIAVRVIFGTIVLAFLGGVLGSVLTWFLYGFATEGVSADLAMKIFQVTGWSSFASQMSADYLLDLIDKFITMIAVEAIIAITPKTLRERVRFDGWRQRPLSDDIIKKVRQVKNRTLSLRIKILSVLIFAMISLAVAATAISFVIFRDSTIKDHKSLALGVAALAGSVVDGDRITEFMLKGNNLMEYNRTEKLLTQIRDSSPGIEYVYVYQILPDGCHVVFDLDTEEEKGADPGTVIEFDESFSEYIPILLSGGKIEPIITNDTYGWLLTAYEPIYNTRGETVAYAAADINMEELVADGNAFFAKMISLFMGFFVFVLAIGLWLAEYGIILPLNTMALGAGKFASDSKEHRRATSERIHQMDICTGDEIENLYESFKSMTDDTIQYVADIKQQSKTIKKMQNGLILVLADIVESRDKCTGQHVRKTAAYTRIILEQMKKQGVYADQLSDAFIQDVVNSAPLHDVGKINVPDAVLNKPGKLTEEEYAIMKAHTTAGRDILTSAIELVPESDYLQEARRLAAYHHERWDGKGYPTGLAGEEIPLSARVMAVADVFDALVSKRSYKEGFSIDKALDIIKQGSGSQFDPKIVEAFLAVEDEAREIAERHEATHTF